MAIGVPVALTAVLAVVVTFGDGGFTTRITTCVISIITAASAMVCALVASRSGRGGSRRFWSLIAAALALWIVGDAIWTWYDVVADGPPRASVADVFYLGFYVLIAAALVVFPVEPTLRSRLRWFLEVVTAGLCLFLLSWALVLNDVVDGHSVRDVTGVLTLVYPAIDVVTLALAIGVLIGADARHRATLWLLTVALGLITAVDSAYARTLAGDGYVPGGVLDIGWTAALAAFAAAAVVFPQADVPPRPALKVPSTTSLWLPYVPVLLAGTIGPYFVMQGFESVLVPFIMTAVCVRQVVAAWENRRLLIVAAEQALRDPLTGLANRALFEDRLAHAMMLRSRDGRSVAVVSLDLDDFRLVNDGLGHPVADRVLVAVGERIAAGVRTGDTPARIDGDEFAVLIEDPVDEAQLVVRRIVDAVTEPIVVDGHELLMRPSVGLAVATPNEPTLDDRELMRRAAAAMYAAKRSRSARVHTFDVETASLTDDHDATPGTDTRRTRDGAARVRLLGELRTAIDDGELTVVYQPKFDLTTETLAGVEALLRWPHPRRGLLAPDEFLPLVQQHALMGPVTNLVVDMALDECARWRASGSEIPVAVNLFAPSLRDAALPGALIEAMMRRGLPERLLTVEITEDMVLSDVDAVAEVLRRLRERGIRVAVDDFGSGYSALAYLRDLPVDEVKLDRHFIAPVTTDARAAAVVRAVIELTHGLGMTVVAEGIEDPQTAAWLREHRCDVGQGFYFGRPVGADVIAGLAASGTSAPGA